MRRFGKRLVLVALAALVVQFYAVATPAAGAHSDPVIINSLNDTGRYLELSAPSLDTTLDAANADGIAFAWLDQGGDSRVAESLSDDYLEDLDEIGSRYRTVVVLTSEGYAASSSAFDSTEISSALDASFDSFAAGATARGIEQFSATLTGFLVGQTTGTTTGQAGGSGSTSGGSGGIGFGTIITGIALLGGGFLLFRGISRSRKAKRQAEIDMQEDRAEIKEQLKNNADRVINLGDRVIATGNQQMIRRYEEASTTYQDVSQSIDSADTAAVVDELDDRIDHAEWQFEAIEAELSGEPIPKSPAEREAEENARAEVSIPPAPTGRAGDARRSQDRSVVTSPRTGRAYPTAGSSRRRSGGMGGMGGALGSILGSVVLNGGLGGGRSRRSQRRSGGMGGLEDILGGGNRRRTTSGGGRSGGGMGGLGGGVLKRGGSGRARRTTRSSGSRSTRGSSRSRSTRSKGRGGRSF